MTDWQTVNIGSVCDGIFDGPHATPPKSDAGPVFLRIENIKDGRVDLADIRHIADEDFPRWTKRVTPQGGDVVFCYEASLGRFAMISDGFHGCLGRRLALMRPNLAKVVPRFLLYATLGPQFQAVVRKMTVHGSTVDRLMLRDFPSFPIMIPTLCEQHAIVSVLGALDDKIELNRRMNETLEAMAREIFLEWKRSTAPDLRPLGSLADFAVGGAWGEDQPSDRSTEHVQCLRGIDLASLVSGKFPDRTPRRWVSEKQKLSRGIGGYEILIEGSGSNCGRSLLWLPDHKALFDAPVVYSNFCKRLQMSDALSDHEKSAIWMSMYVGFLAGEIATFRTGTSIPNLDAQAMLAHFMVALPDEGWSDRIHAALLAWLSPSRMRENLVLGSLRDMLLPKLLSGEVRPRQAEQVVEAAT